MLLLAVPNHLPPHVIYLAISLSMPCSLPPILVHIPLPFLLYMCLLFTTISLFVAGFILVFVHSPSLLLSSFFFFFSSWCFTIFVPFFSFFFRTLHLPLFTLPLFFFLLLLSSGILIVSFSFVFFFPLLVELFILYLKFNHFWGIDVPMLLVLSIVLCCDRCGAFCWSFDFLIKIPEIGDIADIRNASSVFPPSPP